MLRHLDSPESKASLDDIGHPRNPARKLRAGAPRLHWIEQVYVEAFRRTSFFETHQYMPNVFDIHHQLFQPISSQDIREIFGTTVKSQSIPSYVLRQVKQAASSYTWKKLIHLT